MFKDERIIKEISNLKRVLLMVFGIIALLTIILKATCAHATMFPLYIVEITCLIICAGILIIDKINSPKDEREEFEKNGALDKFFKYGVITIYFIYSLNNGIIIGKITDKNVSITPNNFINICLFFATFISLATFKFKNIYLNYSFIQENTKEYFKKVLLNILKIFGFIFFCLSISFTISLLLNLNNIYNIITLFISWIIALFISGIMLCGIYLIFSIIERIQYNFDNKYEEKTPKSSYITITLEIIATILIIVLFVIILKPPTPFSDNINAQLVAYYQTLISSFRNYIMIALAVIVCYYYGDYVKRNKNNKLIYFFFGILTLCFVHNIKGYLLPYLQLYITNNIIEISKQRSIVNNYQLVFSIIQTIIILFSLVGFCKAHENKIIKIALIVITFALVIVNILSIFQVMSYKLTLLCQYELIYLIFLVTSIIVLTIDLVKTLKD